MGVMAVGAEEVGSFPGARKVSRSFPVNTRSPISVLRPVTFAAESVTLGEFYQFAVVQSQPISIPYVVTVETPSHRFGVMEFDIGVLLLQLPFLPIDLHRGMTAATGVHSLGHRRRSIFFNDSQGRGSEKKQQKQRGHCCVEYFHDRCTAFLLEQRDLRHPYSVLPSPKI
jgi:hypothetical protein